MDRFDEENVKGAQGNTLTGRLKAQGNKLLDAIRRRQSMTLTTEKLGYFFTGGASIAAMALIAINTGLIPDQTKTQGILGTQTAEVQEEFRQEKPSSVLKRGAFSV